MRRIYANLLLLLVGAVWGMGFVAQSTAMDAIEPVFFTGIRFLAAAIAVLPFAIWEQKRRARKAPENGPILTRKNLVNYIILGAILFSALGTQQIGLLTTSVTNSGFLTGVYVVMVPVLGLLVLRQVPHAIIWPASALTLTGIFLLSGGSLTGLTTGDYWTIICAVLWACHVLFLGRVLSQKDDAKAPFTLATIQFFTCAVLGLVLAAFFENVSWASVVAAAPEILFAGVMSGGVAFTLQAVAQQYTTAPQAAIFMSSEALFAALFGAIILGERIGFSGYIGCLLIFTAMLAVEIIPMLRLRARPQIS
ncbi:DMT family transporter [Ahrensia marina]|uniref:MFS transporter n=1 Tax=Ahrensia marina TaxID=1514904 RepID=A0A0N0E8Z2_9HYPH|nr:DMT family transporter [Ahrensia marina]KPB02925.1 MFS transporter [Ahrensia marina]